MNDIQVIGRATIPAITSVEESGVVHRLGELRDFSWSEQLKSFMGSGSGFSASWVQLADQEVLEPHTHPVLSMMVFYAGSGQMIGDITRPLAGDEVVVVPPGCLHGFVGGPGGLYALSIQFAHGLYSTPDEPRVVFSQEQDSLDGLVELSEQRAAAFASRTALAAMAGAIQASAAKRRAFVAALEVWLNGVDALVASSYATCSDARYHSAFRESLLEVVQHRTARRDGETKLIRDSALQALTNWFTYQMYVLDNAEKTAVLALVVHKVNAIVKKGLGHVLGERQSLEAFGPTVSDPDARAAWGIALLHHATPQTYARCKKLIGEAWDMADAMLDRLATVTLSGRAP